MTFLDAITPGALRTNHEVFCHYWSDGAVTPLTYCDLYRGALAYVDTYRVAGLGRGDVVLIALPHSPELLHAFLGALMTGCVPSFMPPPTVRQDRGLYWASHRQLFARIGAGAVVTYRANADDLRRTLRDLPLTVFVSEDVRATAKMRTDAGVPIEEPEEIARASTDIAVLQHSSGTTGLKKGVALSFDAIDRQVEAYAAAIELDSRDRIVSWLPLYHDMGLIACLILPFIKRVPVVWLDPFEWVARPAMLFEAIDAHGGTLAWLPNFAFHHLARTVADEARVDLSGVRAFIDCSEPCKVETFETFAQRFGSWGVRREQLQVCYAMAEGVFAVTQTPIGAPPSWCDRDGGRLVSVGTPVGSWQVRIVDPAGKPVDEDVVGEVAITGGSLFSGYFQLPDETARKFRDAWYLTGDLGLMRDGRLFITGRTDDLIIVHGKNVYAHDVEFVVNQVPGVKPGRVVAAGSFVEELGTQELLIFAERDESGEQGAPNVSVSSHRELDAALARTIKSVVLQHTGLLPRTVHVVEPGWLVKTTSGKISRGENLRRYRVEQQVIA